MTKKEGQWPNFIQSKGCSNNQAHKYGLSGQLCIKYNEKGDVNSFVNVAHEFGKVQDATREHCELFK